MVSCGCARKNGRWRGAALASQWQRVESLLREQWSPEQVAGSLRRGGELSISHETIYRHVWRDKKRGGRLHLATARGAQELPETLRALRQPRSTGRQTADWRAAGCGREPAAGRPREIDTMKGQSSHRILTLVERKSGYALIGKLRTRTAEETTQVVLADYEQSCDDYLVALCKVSDLNTHVRYAHPWFGPLNAADLHALSGGHLCIHRVQIERILAGLGARRFVAPSGASGG